MRNIDRKNIFSAALAIIGACGIAIQISFLARSKAVRGSFFVLPTAVALYMIYKRIFLRKRSKADKIFNLCVAILLSVMLVVGAIFDAHLQRPIWKIFLYIALLAPALYPIAVYIIRWFDNASWNKAKKSAKSEKDAKQLSHICFAVIIVAWILYFLALYPGVYCADASYWYAEFQQSNVGTHWSPVVAGLFYICISFGQNILKSAESGMAVYALLQMMFSLYAVWCIMKFLRDYVSERWCIVVAVFFVLVPTHAILAITSLQDGWFTACFALCLIELVKCTLTDKNYLAKPSHLIRLAALFLLLCMSRNNGLYAMLVMVFFMLFVSRNKRLYLAIASSIIIYLIYFGPVLSALGVTKSPSLSEMMSLPVQQMSIAYRNSQNKLTKEDRKEMRKYIPDSQWKIANNDGISDQRKNSFKDRFRNDPISFIKLYIQLGLKVPGDYIDGAIRQTIGLWYPDKKYPDTQIWHVYIYVQSIDVSAVNEPHRYISIRQDTKFPLGLRVIKWLFGWTESFIGYGGDLETNFSNVPILSLLCKMGIYFWLILYLFIYCIYRRQKAALIPLSLCIGLTITILLSPVMYYRYYAPIMFSALLILQLPHLFTNYCIDKKQ